MIWESTSFKYSRYIIYLLFGITAFYFNSVVVRANFVDVIICYTSLFLLYAALIIIYRKTQIQTREIIIAAIGIRLMLVFTVPNLSDDYFRFIWDGIISNLHINPFAITPVQLTSVLGDTPTAEFLQQSVYNNLNSKAYHSIYPPFCQWIFHITSFIAGNSIYHQVIFLKLCIVLFEAGSIFMIIRIAKILQINMQHAVLYAFNPLVIIELTGNVHMEAFMIFLMLSSIYFLYTKRFYPAAILWGLAVSVKLWPLMFLPILFSKYGVKKTLSFSGLVIAVAFLTFAPYLYSGFFDNYFSSFILYFKTFEFNASIYYALSWVASYNYFYMELIQQILPIVLIAIILLLTISKKYSQDYFILMLVIFSCYLFLGSTVHPWYITPLIVFSTLTAFRFPILWSFLICFTYITYSYIPYQQNYSFIAIEYIVLFIYIIIEFRSNRITIQ